MKYRSTLTADKLYKVTRQSGSTKPYTTEITFKYLHPSEEVEGASVISIQKIEVKGAYIERVSERQKFYNGAFGNLEDNITLVDTGKTVHFFHSDLKRVLDKPFGPIVEI